MCTSFTSESTEKKHFLARTMDFGFELEGNPVVCPRNYKWQSDFERTVRVGKYGFVGAGRKLGQYFFADGVNEHGLSCASLYFPDEVNYSKVAIEGKVSVAPHEIPLLILTEYKNIAELEKNINNICIVEADVPLLGIVTPLHWILTDTTGRSVVIEPTDLNLKIQENPVGVMTNSPELNWHLKNLNNYVNIAPEQVENKHVANREIHPFGQGSGSIGLPGDFTPPSRFVRAVFFKYAIEKAAGEEQAVSNCWHVLNTVRIPKGVVIQRDGDADYTQYVAAMCSESRTYYFSNYENNRIQKIELTDTLLDHLTEPAEFKVLSEQDMNIVSEK
ncbi:choloylglycine hydrolase family protein [Enterococcus sp. AZ072]|uniref:choloylglycine hydrolase family protein n=1 Tax=unclassified Enterococcus TaxID=2608891 RepID=UPI003D28DEB7